MSPAYPHLLLEISTAAQAGLNTNLRQRVILALIWITVLLGTYVIDEPAPYDIAVMIVFALAISMQAIQVSGQLLVAASALFLFLVVSVILTSPPVDWAAWLRHSGATAILTVSWLLFAGLTHRCGPQSARTILNACTITAVIAASLGLAGYFGAIPELQSTVIYGQRIKSFFKDPNVFGPFLMAPTLVCGMWIQSKSATALQRILAVAAAILLLAANFLSFSRASYATTIFAVILYAVLTGILRSWRSFLVLLGTVSFAVFLLGLSPSATEFLSIRLETQRYDEDRFEIFNQALGLGSGNLLGVGAGQSNEVLGYGVHSMFLRLFADHGAPGLAAFLLFLSICMTRMVTVFRRSREREARLLAAVILASALATLLNGLVIENIHWRHLWLLLGLCWYPLPEPVRYLNLVPGSALIGELDRSLDVAK
jgi:O-antigen ligase